MEFSNAGRTNFTPYHAGTGRTGSKASTSKRFGTGMTSENGTQPINYKVLIRDPMGNMIRWDEGVVLAKGGYCYDFRQPGMVGGMVIGTIAIEWDSTDGDR